METTLKDSIEDLFTSLSPEEKVVIISHGIALYLSALTKRLFLSQAKMHLFEEKYRTSLDKLDAEGLPDDANYEMHEDYLMWHHWADNAVKLKAQIDILRTAASQGLYAGEALYVSY